MSVIYHQEEETMVATEIVAPNLDAVMSYRHSRLLTRLHEKVGMDEINARERFEDTKRFLYLCAISEEPLAPTEQIDEVWHNFILYTRDYVDFCDTHFGFFLHHIPWSKAEVAQSDGSIVRKTREFAERGSKPKPQLFLTPYKNRLVIKSGMLFLV
jgi:hypothetical protein